LLLASLGLTPGLFWRRFVLHGSGDAASVDKGHFSHLITLEKGSARQVLRATLNGDESAGLRGDVAAALDGDAAG
jgi:hypothetical protein